MFLTIITLRKRAKIKEALFGLDARYDAVKLCRKKKILKIKEGPFQGW
jgi:hypothetical protein